MIKSATVVGAVFGCLFAAAAFRVPKTAIYYETIEVGSGRWQVTFDVTNISLTPSIEDFTVWSDFGLHGNLAIEMLSIADQELLLVNGDAWRE